MELWAEAMDDMIALESESDSMTLDQRLKLLEIKALLAISQDVSAIPDAINNPRSAGA